MSKRIYISATSDLVTDQRVHKIALSLHDEGHKVTVVGRKKRQSKKLEERPYKTKRLRVLAEKGLMFYAFFNIELFLYLMSKKRADLYLAVDLDTLLANFMVSRSRKSKLYYDAHEYFTGVPELLSRRWVRGFWKLLERWLVPKVHTMITVNDSLATLYRREYKKSVSVVQNYPMPWKEPEVVKYEDYTEIIPAKHSETAVVQTFLYHMLRFEKRKILLYQGAVNKDRGVAELMEAMEWVEDAVLLIVGTGDEWRELKNKLKRLPHKDKIMMIGQVPFERLRYFTELATLGLSIEKPTNINYRLASPNKVVDYIHAQVPVLTSRLVEVERLVNDFKIGECIDNHDPRHIALKINLLLSNPVLLLQYKSNCKKCMQTTTWEQERRKLIALF